MSLLTQAKQEQSPTYKLAIWFVEDVLGERWDATKSRNRLLLKQAKKLVNPKPPPDYEPEYDENDRRIPYKAPHTVEQVQDAITFLIREKRREDADWLPNSLDAVLWQWADGTPVIDFANRIPKAPPQYEKLAFAEWFFEYGERLYGNQFEAMREAFAVEKPGWMT